MSTQAKEKFKLVTDYLVVSDDLECAAAFSEGIEQGYLMSAKRMKKLKTALIEVLGQGRRNRDDALKYAREVLRNG